MPNYQINLFTLQPSAFIIYFSIIIMLFTICILCNLSNQDIQEIYDYFYPPETYSYPLMGNHVDYQVLREISIIPYNEEIEDNDEDKVD